MGLGNGGKSAQGGRQGRDRTMNTKAVQPVANEWLEECSHKSYTMDWWKKSLDSNDKQPLK